MNFGAVALAALCGLAVIRIWYAPWLFGKPWHRADNGRQRIRQGQPWRFWGLGLVFSLIAAGAFAQWLGPRPSLPHALQQGLLIGFCFSAVGFWIYYLFAHYPLRMWWIEGGCRVAQFLAYALVLGLWK